MRLAELEATFVGEYNAQGGFRELPTVEGAQGLLFICPKCQNHSVLVWFKNPRNAPVVPIDALPKPGRWSFSGDTINTVSLVPSVDLSKIDTEHPASPCRCYWHGFVKDGDAT
jgi:hypothetical protein